MSIWKVSGVPLDVLKLNELKPVWAKDLQKGELVLGIKSVKKRKINNC